MSPSGEEYGGATPDFVGQAYSAEPRVDARARGTTEHYADARARGAAEGDADSLPNSDVLSELARITSRLDSIEQGYRAPNMSPAPARGTPLRGVYGPAAMGAQPSQMPHLQVHDLGAGAQFGVGVAAPGYFSRRSGVYGPGAETWRRRVAAQYEQEYAAERQRLQNQFHDEFQQQYQGLQQQYQQEFQQGARQLYQGQEELRAELQRQQELNRQLQQQLNQRGGGTPMTQEEIGGLDPNFTKIPTAAQGKINIEPFDGSEIYENLGAGYVRWGQQLLVKFDIAEQACGFRFPEYYKVSRHGEFMRGKAARFYNQRVHGWWKVNPTLGYIMDRMVEAYKIVFSKSQIIKLFSARKDRGRSWNDHLMYLVALQEATNSSEELVLENIVKYAQPESQALIIGKYDNRRVDYLTHAEEIVSFIQGLEDETTAVRTTGRDIVNAMTETRTCHNCGLVGHIARDCPAPRVARNQGRGRGRGGRGGNAHGNRGRNVRWALSAASAELLDDDWILDTGASCHIVRTADMLTDAVATGPADDLVQPDGSRLEVTRRGTVLLNAAVDGDVAEIELSDACFAPRLSRNLVSYGRLVDRGCVIGLVNGRHAIMKDGCVVFYVVVKNHVLVIDRDVQGAPRRPMSEIVMSAVSEAPHDTVTLKATLMEYHERFGHLNLDTIERLVKDPRSGIELTDRTRKHCPTCAKGKHTRAHQPQVDSGESAPTDRIGGVICSDLKGPITPRDRGGNRYLVNFVCHLTNYCRVFLAKTKDQAARMFEHFLIWFQKRFNCRVHVLRTDGGGEYANVDLFCRENGVARQVTEAGNQAGNGKAERMHRTVMNIIRCLLFGSGLPLHFWGDAAEYAVYILNRMPTRANPNRASPLEMLEGAVQRLTGIVVFGSPCDVFRDPKKNSLKARSVRGLIVGKNDETKGFKVFIPADNVVITTRHIQNVETLSDAENDELRRVLEKEEEEGLENLARSRQHEHETSNEERARDAAQDAVVVPKARRQRKKKTVTDAPPRRSARAKKKSARQLETDGEHDTATTPTQALANAVAAAVGKDRHAGEKEIVAAVVSAVNQVFQAEYANLPDPKNYKEAERSPDRALWLRARIEELQSLRANKTWRIVKAVNGMMRLHTKWVHKKKKNSDGTIERYKARLVACGNEQVLGVNYLLTFAAVLDLTSGKVILALAWLWRVPARHFDVPSAYVKAAKEDGVEIYLHVPDGMELSPEELREHGVATKNELALCLERSLYGLKQAGRLWHQLLHETLINIGFTQCITDSCMYYKIDAEGTTLVGTYVDDLLVTGTSEDRVNRFFAEMVSLELKDLGPAENFLGMRIAYDPTTGYTIDQEATILELLAKNGLAKVNATRTPMGDEQQDDVALGGAVLPSKGPGTPEHPTVRSFQSLVGSLLWVARCTRPDISFAVHRATRRSHAPTMDDFKLAKRIARYLAGTAGLKLVMADDGSPPLPMRLDCFTDADFAGDKSDRKSVSGGVLRLNGMLVGWHCRKQTAVALSTAEAEYVAASMGAKELLGLKELVGELELAVAFPMSMKMDNQAAIKQVENEASSSQAKHVDVRLKFVSDYCQKGVVKPTYVGTQEMLADLLTKALPAPRLVEARAAIGLA